jgi:Bifunctional DNA primase/polymerase, N-terminal
MILPDLDDLLADAVERAQHHWRVFPLRGKVPAIPRAHSRTLYLAFPCAENLVAYPNRLRDCKGGCGRHGHGVYDATDDVETVIQWWSGPYRGANIGARIPESMLMIDIDPRNGGLGSWSTMIGRYGPFPECMMTLSGRGDGGVHRYVRRPPGIFTARRLGPGIDLKTSCGYAVMPRSIHPETGMPYTPIDGPVPAPPNWFVELVTMPAPLLKPRQSRLIAPWRCASGSPAEAFSKAASWEDILGPHGWTCLDPDPDEDGACWLHPHATSSCSASVRHGCLFVWSTNTAFEVTTAGDAHGYTKFKAYAVLNHGGDMSAASRCIKRELAL